jgi:hypothetical protein
MNVPKNHIELEMGVTLWENYELDGNYGLDHSCTVIISDGASSVGSGGNGGSLLLKLLVAGLGLLDCCGFVRSTRKARGGKNAVNLVCINAGRTMVATGGAAITWLEKFKRHG